MRKNQLIQAVCLALACAFCSVAQAPVYKTLYLPQVTKPGGNPTALFETSPGVFSVLTASINITWGSTFITVTSNATSKVIYSLPPNTQSVLMVQGTNAVSYGPTFLHQDLTGYYSYFSLSASGQTAKQYPFPGQWGSFDETVLAPPGVIYDIAGESGPSNTTNYALAKIEESGQITILPQFPAGAVRPWVGLVIGADGNFYGIGYTTSNGPANDSYVFRVTPGGAYSLLAGFPDSPYSPRAPALVAASDGNLYVASGSAGANRTGAIFQVTLSGDVQDVASFPAKGLAFPGSLMEAADGNLYGTTSATGIFKYDLTTKAVTELYQLAAGGSQGACPCQMVQGVDGKLYAASVGGGAPPGIGVVFSLYIGLPKPLPLVMGLYPPSGPVGQQVILWGNYVLGATKVTFNEVPATTFLTTSARSIKVTVPAGASTGAVAVTTPNGTSTVTQVFTVK